MKRSIGGVFVKLPFVGEFVRRNREFARRIQSIEANNADLRYRLCKYLPSDKRPEALSDWFWSILPGERLNLENPQTFNEKIQWLKLHGEDTLLTRLADKYEVRQWVSERIGEKYLVPLLGVWNSAEEIEFDALPQKFVLKATHGCEMNIIVSDARKLDREVARKRIERWLNLNFAFMDGFQMQYANIRPRVLAEEYMENSGGDIFDYKFWCFKGKCHYIQFLSERKKSLKMAFFDRQWNVMPFVYDFERNPTPPPKPDNLELMIELSEKLAAGFEHVRVDFYRLDDGTIRFGEMTFTSASGRCKWDPPEWNLRLGQMFDVKPGDRIDG